MQVFPQARPLRQVRQQLDGAGVGVSGVVRGSAGTVSSMEVVASVELRSTVVTDWTYSAGMGVQAGASSESRRFLEQHNAHVQPDPRIGALGLPGLRHFSATELGRRDDL